MSFFKFLKSIPRTFVFQALYGKFQALIAIPLFGHVAVRTAVVAVVPTIVFFYHDPNRHFLWVTDWDIRVIYESLLINSGFKNYEPAHVGYAQFYLLAKWFRLLEFLSVLPGATIQGIPPAPQSDAVLQILMYWTRMLTLLLGIATSITVMFLTQVLTESRFYGVVAALIFVGCESINTNLLQIRSELPSLLFALLAIVCTLVASRVSERPLAAVGLIGVAAFCALFSLYAKTASIPILVLIPLFGVLLSRPSGEAAGGSARSIRPRAAALLTGMGTVVAYVWLTPFVGAMTPGAYGYNGLIAAYILICVWLYGRINDLGIADTVAAISAMVIGLAAAQGLLLGTDPNLESKFIANHIGYLAGVSSTTRTLSDANAAVELTDLGSALGLGDLVVALAGKFVANLGEVAKESYFNLCWECRRLSIVYFLSLLFLIAIWRRSTNLDRLRAVFLTLAVIFVEATMRVHYFNPYYHMYVDGLLVAAAAYYLVKLIGGSTAGTRQAVAVVAVIFVGWYIADGMARKTLYPHFAHHVGMPLPILDRMPLLADRLEDYERDYKQHLDAIEKGAIKKDTQIWWWRDTRTFLGSERPWR